MKIEIIQSNSVIQNNAGIVLIDKIAGNLNLFQQDSFLNVPHRADRIPDGTILQETVFLEALGLTNFVDVSQLGSSSIIDEIFGRSLSQETLRQRLNQLSQISFIFYEIDRAVIELLKNSEIKTIYFEGKKYYTLDIDVTPFINPKVKKEGIEYTYKGENGYAPMMAYLDDKAICFELRPGSQHSECGTPEFLERCLKIIDGLNISRNQILLRADSGNDASELIDFCKKNKIYFIIKRNFRRESKYPIIRYAKSNVKPDKTNGSNLSYIFVDLKKHPANVKNEGVFCVYEVKEIYDEKGEVTLTSLLDVDSESPDYGKEPWVKYEVDGYWTNLNIKNSHKADLGKEFAATCIQAYHDHATSEQFHSEVKSDMNLELLPSKYFATNKLYLSLAVLAFNILRKMGDYALNFDPKFQHRKGDFLQRIRVKTVINKLCRIACIVTRHARKIVMKLGKNCSFYKTFAKIYATS